MANNNFDINQELSKEIANPELDTSTGIKSILKKMFIPGVEGDNLLYADDAYLRAKYGEYTNHKELFHKLLRRIKDQIKYKAEQKETWCFLSILPETTEYLEQISNALKQYGYQVWILNRNVLETINTDNKVNNDTIFMLITWDKVY